MLPTAQPITTAVHVHRLSTNPRYSGLCDCGASLTSADVKRDRRFEDEITSYLCSGLNLDAEPLNVYAGRRADLAEEQYGYDFPALDRDLEREACEELADARNYITWRLDGLNRGLWHDTWKVEHLQQALKLVALAFEELRSAQG